MIICRDLQVLGYTGNEDAKKFFLDGEITLEKIKVGILSVPILESVFSVGLHNAFFLLLFILTFFKKEAF